MGGNLMQMLQQYGGGGAGDVGDSGFPGAGVMVQPRQMASPRRGGGNFGGALGLASGGTMPIQGGVGYDGQATSPFEVGGNSGGGGFRWPAWMGPAPQNQLYGSGGPVSAGNGYGAGQLPGGFGYGGGQGAGGGGGIGAGQMGQMNDLQDMLQRFQQQVPHYGDLSWGESHPRDMGNGQMAGGMPPWMQRRNPGTRDDQRRAYWDRGMNDNQQGIGRQNGRPMGGYWQRPMGGPMPGQGIPLGAGGRDPGPYGNGQPAYPQTQGGMIKSATPPPQQQQSYQPAQAPAQAPQQPVRRASRDDNNARGWSGY